MPINLPGMIRIFFFIFIMSLTSPFTGTSKNNSGQTPTEPILTFGVIADIQYCDSDPAGTRFYRESLKKLSDAIVDFNGLPLDCIITLGDMIDKNFSSFETVMPLFDNCKSPVYHTLGNHDFSIEKNHLNDLGPMLNTGIGYYSFAIKGIRFIILDSNDLSVYSPLEEKQDSANDLLRELKDAGAQHAYEWNGGIDNEQLTWLDNELKESTQKGEKVFLFSHHPLWPATGHNVLNYKSVLTILEPYDNIISAFCGHNHSGGYGNFDLIHFVNLKGMVETPDLNAYAVVEIYHNKIWIKGRGREKSQILAY